MTEKQVNFLPEILKKNRRFLDPRRNGFFDHNSQKSYFFFYKTVLVFVFQHKNSLPRLSKNAVVTLVKSL
jgi:hypothetical protein